MEDITQAEWQVEQEWLQHVLTVLRARLADVRQVAGSHTKQVLSERRSMWEDAPRFVYDFDDAVELAQLQIELNRTEKDAIYYRQLALKLQRMEDSPYFGRIDFRPQGSTDPDSIYIGIASLHEEPSGDIVVHDWRAPICSLFYDSEVGPAQFRLPSSQVQGDVLLKRQYKIEKGQLQFMFDTSLKIDDEFLQELLGRNVDEKMRNIVTSIQREQNKVIRDESHQVLVVEGPAGSGKTAVALHRAAYLLYRYKESISADNIIIFSPNNIFSDYISAVLPSLGEENVSQTTFHEFAQKMLGAQLQVERPSAQWEFLLTGASAEHLAAIRYKSSRPFLQLLYNYVDWIVAGNTTDLKGIYHQGKVIIRPDEMRRLYHDSYVDIPFARRLRKLEKRALYLLAPLEELRLQQVRAELSEQPDMFDWQVKQESRRRVREEFKPVKEYLKAWAHFDLLTIYKRLFNDDQLMASIGGSIQLPDQWSQICRYTLSRLDQGQVSYEDAGPLLLLRRLLTGWPVLNNARHVIVDEAQDYSQLQYELLNLTFPRSNFTVLGDLNQTIYPDIGVLQHEQITSGLARPQVANIQLSRSYRSTRQIMDFAQAIVQAEVGVEMVARDGPKPVLVQAADNDELIRALAADIAAFNKNGRETIAVVCKTATAARWLHRGLEGRRVSHLSLVCDDDRAFHAGVLVLPVYLAKGLEFDAVAVVNVDIHNYGQEQERKLLYVACTRALHELRLYCAGTPSPLLPSAASGLLEVSRRGEQ